MVAFHQPNPWGFPMYQAVEDLFQSGAATAASSRTDGGAAHQPETLLNNLAVVKDKVQQVHFLVNLVVAQSAPGSIQHESLGMVASDARNLIQDLIVAASSMLCAFQQLAAAEGDDVALSTAKNEEDVLVLPHLRHEGHHIKAGGFMASAQAHAHEAFHTVLHDDALYSYGSGEGGDKPGTPPLLAGTAAACEIIEIDAANLLAKYTHYCQVCGKGFKRDANLRMHMRAHGDEYKTNAALANRTKRGGGGGGGVVGQEAAVGGSGRKYSCPQDGCRWNKNHAKFQPLKSMICVKNHYKRSHCPKMYVCNRCNCKQFAVLSDLRTHEKHCGDLKWMCSCGTTFSRKDKLMGHVALFVGHCPVVSCFTK